MLFVFQVRKSEVAVVTLFGKLEQNRVFTNAGPNCRGPGRSNRSIIWINASTTWRTGWSR